MYRSDCVVRVLEIYSRRRVPPWYVIQLPQLYLFYEKGLAKALGIGILISLYL